MYQTSYNSTSNKTIKLEYKTISDPLPTATIDLNDCLACSGCITSAEAVLITSQSTNDLLAVLNAKSHQVVVSLSPQSVASMAYSNGLTLDQTAYRLCYFFKNVLGVDKVMDIHVAQHISLMATLEEYRSRNPEKPLLASACPGWVCYAEKTQPEMVPFLSRVASPQQIMGRLIKQQPQQIFHVTVMPCYDKKLEASRDDFVVNGVRDVDLVLTSVEIVALIDQFNVDLKLCNEVALDCYGGGDCGFSYPKTVSSTSGGFLEYILANTVDSYTVQQRRNPDYLEYTSGSLKFARAYGFKNIQNLVRSIKNGSKTFPCYVEVMACPSGCINGGGQIKVSKDQLVSVRELFLQNGSVVDQLAVRLWSEFDAQTWMTDFHAVPKTVRTSNFQW